MKAQKYLRGSSCDMYAQLLSWLCCVAVVQTLLSDVFGCFPYFHPRDSKCIWKPCLLPIAPRMYCMHHSLECKIPRCICTSCRALHRRLHSRWPQAQGDCEDRLASNLTMPENEKQKLLASTHYNEIRKIVAIRQIDI